jgi:hypothetical protein
MARVWEKSNRREGRHREVGRQKRRGRRRRVGRRIAGMSGGSCSSSGSSSRNIQHLRLSYNNSSNENGRCMMMRGYTRGLGRRRKRCQCRNQQISSRHLTTLHQSHLIQRMVFHQQIRCCVC